MRRFYRLSRRSVRLRPVQLLGLLLLLAWPTSHAFAQAPTWQRAVPVAQASGGYTQVLATTTDAAGNVYLTGIFYGTVVLGSATLVSNGQADVFVAKWSSATGTYAWAAGAGGSRIDLATGIAVSGSSVYITGDFVGTITFGATTLSNAAALNTDVFVAKLTDAGTSASFTWAQQAGGALDDYPGALVVSGSTVYLSGVSQRQATFGSISVNTPGPNTFVAKLTDAGATAAWVWVQSSGGASLESAPALAQSGSSLYVAGSFHGSSTTFGSTTLTNANAVLGNPDVFVAKLTDAGASAAWVWARSAGGPEYDEAKALAVSGPSVYLTGYFRSATIGFGSTTLANANPTLLTPDVFVAKLTDAGPSASFTWAQQAGGPDIEEVRALAVSGAQVYITGSFNSPTASFGATTLTNSVGDGTADVYVARLTDAGPTASISWAQQAGSPNGDIGRALAIRGNAVYVAGESGGAARFGSQTLPSPASTFGGFWASFTDPLLLASTAPAGPAPLALFPTPATAYVRVPALPAGTAVQLVDALGRVARTTTVSAAAQVSVRGLPAGLYTLRAPGAHGRTHTARLLVE
ncbi:T9SS type A sorting domain-containing protein [Hymenobacter busanensis]|uniref:T9SS type A sorting domain-containing protein n=1 Tax=Hymenobacter busanensis TaxID=2607656 RepID=A0A7L4ZS11_9BACT|nr:T9SS type A sorting domain-containing protein [Hymenobacter busanensis]KAA9327622.1 T9SS type A sorting domain-containing protein [Hymenobacter busanensis]QHJ06039.1 T9SS type A sorting domain-containing protein [Hymenobacter busanensis]